jgi:competence ComEA-like helix-hairpin-helix protein
MAAERAQMARIDLNKASRDELAGLPGVEPAVADAIVKYRDEHGGFSKLDDLTKVPGLGAQALEGLRARLSLKGGANGATSRSNATAKTATQASGKRAPAKRPVAEKAAEATSVAGRGTAVAREAAEAGAKVVRAAAGGDPAAGARAANRPARRAAETAGEAASGTVARAGEAAGEAARAGAETIEAAEARTAATISAARDAAEEIASHGRSDARAAAASAGTLLSGLQDLQRGWMVYLQEQMRENLDAGRALACARTPRDVIEVQTRYARSSWSRFTTETSKLANLTMRVVGGSLEPLQARGRAKAEEALRRTHR